jgi:radical SAM protein with 4Fe4S-binding SPASM domain
MNLKSNIEGSLRNQVKKANFFGKFLKFLHEYKLVFNFYLNPSNSGIKEVHLSLVNYCNLRCKWCSLDHSQKKEIMDEELLYKFLNNMISDKRFNSIKKLNLWNSGETLLHPNLIKMLKIVKRYKEKKKDLKIEIVTNGMILNKNLAKKIIDLNVLDKITFSVDGGSKKKLEEIRRGTKWEILKKNISDFKKLSKGKIEIKIICIVDLKKPLNINWMEKEFKDLFNSVDAYRLTHPSNWLGKIKIKYPKELKFIKPNPRICLAVMQGLTLLQDGNVVPCCTDLNGTCILGNLYEQDLYSICYSKKRRKMIKYFLQGRKKDIPLCKDCNRFDMVTKTVVNKKKK